MPNPPTSQRFLIARNPDPDSRLPYLLRLPIGDGVVLKVRDTWPRTARVFCARAGAWPPDAEIIEDVPMLLCRRRGPAIDIALDRPRENRSQIVFTTLRDGREGIFWQTRKVVGSARPGARIPGRRASGLTALEIVVDTRERYPFRFAKQQASTSRAALPAGDYAVRRADGSIVAAVERKSIDDLASGLNNGTLDGRSVTSAPPLPKTSIMAIAPDSIERLDLAAAWPPHPPRVMQSNDIDRRGSFSSRGSGRRLRVARRSEDDLAPDVQIRLTEPNLSACFDHADQPEPRARLSPH